MIIQRADLTAKDLQDLLTFHLSEAAAQNCSSAFSLDRLGLSDMHFFEARSEIGDLMGCAGLKLLGSNQGEIKSVRTHPDHLRKGVSRALMNHLTDFAKKEGLTKLMLETHPTPAYKAARVLYEGLGYSYRGPFADYDALESSVFMEKEI